MVDVTICENCSKDLPVRVIANCKRICDECYAKGYRKKRAAYGTGIKSKGGARARSFREQYPHTPFHMTSRYLAGKAGVYSDLTLEDAYDIHHTPDTCGYCGKERGPNDGKRAFHIDHIIPMVQGGPNSRWNLVKVCASCNSSKGSASLADFHSRTASLTDDRYDAIIANMAAMSGKSTEQVNGLLTQSHEFEQAHQRERARLMALLVS